MEGYAAPCHTGAQQQHKASRKAIQALPGRAARHVHPLAPVLDAPGQRSQKSPHGDGSRRAQGSKGSVPSAPGSSSVTAS